MKGKRMNEADKRIPVRADNLQLLREIAVGVGGTYDDALRVILQSVINPGESAVDAGKRLKAEQTEKVQ